MRKFETKSGITLVVVYDREQNIECEDKNAILVTCSKDVHDDKHILETLKNNGFNIIKEIL